MAEPEIRGLEEFLRRLEAVPGEIRQATAAGLFEIGEDIMADSVETYVPVDEGILRGSAFVNDPVVTAEDTSVTIGFGGPAKDYAGVQHEREDFHHTVGQAKYLTTPAMIHAPSIADRIAFGIWGRLRRMFT